MLPGANPLSSRAQNRGFCVRMGDFPPVFGTPEHKIGIFVLELPESWPGGGKYGLGEEKSAQVLGLRAFTNLSCCSECRSTRSAILLGAPLYLECLPTTCWPRNEEPGNESRGTKAGERKPGNEGPAGLPAAEVEEVLVYCGVVVEFGMEGGYQLIALLCRYYFSIYRG